MRNLFFVSVAFSIFTGTSINASAQHLPRYEVAASTPMMWVTKNITLPATAFIAPKLRFKTNEILTVATELCSRIQFKFGQLLDRNIESLTDVALFSFIDEWWEIRYRYGGTGKTGIDCSAFTGLLLKDVYGLLVPRTARLQYDACEKVAEEDMLEGDLVFFNTRGGVSHVGVYLGGGYFAHASSSKGITIDSLDEKYYRKRFISGGRVQEVEGTFSGALQS